MNDQEGFALSPAELQDLALPPALSEYSERDILWSLLEENQPLFDEQNLSTSPPSPPQIFQPLINATTAFPMIKKEPYDPALFEVENTPNKISKKNKFEFESEMEDGPASKKQKSVEEKATARAEQQRLASRRYRQKKKMLVESLEDKMKEIQEEKQKIEREHAETIALVNKLRQENASLRKTHQIDSTKIEKERLDTLAKLDELVRNNAPEEQLIPCLSIVKANCRKISSLGLCHLNMWLSPSVVHQLVKNGFFDSKAPPTLNTCSTVSDYAKRIIALVPSLTEEQNQEIMTIVESHQGEFDSIKTEREELNQEIAQFFTSSPPEGFKKESTDLPRLISIMSTLEYLRKNLTEENEKIHAASCRLIHVLTPRQQAQFFLEVEFQHRSVMQLKSLWDTMKKTAETVDTNIKS